MVSIQIHPLFFLVAFLLGFFWSAGDLFLSFMMVGVITISVFVHEAGHALTGLAFKQKVKISLLPFGGLTEKKGKRLKGWQEFLITLMGPAFGFILYLMSQDLARAYPEGVFGKLFSLSALVNLWWTILNLLPVMPLDGGQLVRIVLQSLWGIRGLKASCIFSMVIGIFFVVIFFLKQDFLIGSIFALFTYESWRLYADVQHLTDSDTEVSFQRLFAKGEKAYEKGDMEKSHEIFTELRRQVQKGALFNLATLHLAEIAFSNSKYDDGYHLLEPIKQELNLTGLALFQELSFRTSHWADALFAGTKVAQSSPTAELALQNARASGELGDKTAEAGWMQLYHKMNR